MLAPLGTVFLLSGFAIFTLALMDTATDVPLRLPASWYTFRYMWYLLGIGLFASGCIALKKSSEP